MKRAIIVHGWGGSPEEPMHRWLKKELENKGYSVIAPKMPDPDKPEIGPWVSKLKDNVEEMNKDTLFIGHSIGCQTIMRFLEKENLDERVNIIFIAGWFKLDNLEDEESERIAKPWIETPVNFEKVKERVNHLIVFLSSDEPYGCLDENKEIFEELGARVIILKNRGHFSEDTGIKSLPEILEFIR